MSLVLCSGTLENVGPRFGLSLPADLILSVQKERRTGDYVVNEQKSSWNVTSSRERFRPRHAYERVSRA